MLDLTGFRLMRRVQRMVGCGRLLVVNITVGDFGSATWVHHCIRTSAMSRCVNSAFSGGSSFFTNRAGLFFFASFLSFFFLSLFRFFFFWTRLLTLRNLRYVATRLPRMDWWQNATWKQCSGAKQQIANVRFILMLFCWAHFFYNIFSSYFVFFSSAMKLEMKKLNSQ